MATKIPKIDEKDNIIGKTTIAEAKANGWYRRISRVFLFDNEGNILLQRRGSEVVAYPNKLDQAAGGHVDLGETYMEAAYRELQEELGLDTVKLTEVLTSYRNRDCFEAAYIGFIDKNTTFTPDPREVAELMWMNFGEFENKLKNESDLFIDVLDNFWFDNRDKMVSNI